MKIFVRNTTALATCLSLILPHLAMAQTDFPADGLRLAQDQQEDTLEQRLKKRMEAEQRKERQEQRAKRQQENQKQRDAQQKPKGQKQDQDQKQRPDQERKKQAQQQKEQAQKREEQAERREQQAERREEAREKQQEQAQKQRERAAEQRREAERKEREERRLREAERDKDLEDRLRERMLEQRRQEQRADRLQLQRTEDRSARMSRLDRRLQDEVGSGLDADDLRCLNGTMPPCGNGSLITPNGVVVEQGSNGRYALAPAERQIYFVDDDGDLRVRNSGNSANYRTYAAREAARGSDGGDLQALAASLSELDQRQNRRVTDRDYRSSDEDFGTSLHDALRRNDQRVDRDDDDDNDLTKALLLGLGALAVGSVLNNNSQVALSSSDRVVLDRPDGSQQVYRDDEALLRQPGSEVQTEQFDDGSSRSIVTRSDGSKVVTIRDRDMNILRRTLISPDGRTSQLIDDTSGVPPVDVAQLPQPVTQTGANSDMDQAALREALYREAGADRRFTLGQIRNIHEVRSLVQPVGIDSITFDTGSAAIRPDQASQLSELGGVIRDAIAKDPQEMFLIEGYTDTVGSSAANLALSDRRAESVALALTEYFDVPPENLVVQGYGEDFLKVEAEGDIRDNRRSSVRRITDLLQTPDAS
ncbi:OmpA family protein [Paracoccus homiensis]|uniref:OmpA family protein n=1 Tax=Paracoccus homiensis TaxID=364199 RepID=A0A1I0DAQ4_9RHOB|nr:OmpA family protein [Paracoccus homiensis]SET29367.1 OmpA family protein [Paracoccus homiensis]